MAADSEPGRRMAADSGTTDTDDRAGEAVAVLIGRGLAVLR
jgi:hypothetical protein